MRKLASVASLMAVLSLGPAVAAHEAPSVGHYQTGNCDSCSSDTPWHWDMVYSPSGTSYYNYVYGSIYQGTPTSGSSYYPFSNCNYLYVSYYTFYLYAYGSMPSGWTSRSDNRGYSAGPWIAYTEPSIEVTRNIYVPPDGGPDAVRWIDEFENTSSSEEQLTVYYYCYYYDYSGCYGGSCTETSSGDSTYSADDQWFVRDSAADSGYPAYGMLYWGDGAEVTPTASTVDYGYYSYVYFDLTIPAGETKRLMSFGTQADNADEAQATIEELMFLPDSIMGDFGGNLPEVANFITDGRPIVNVGGPYVVAEGGEIELNPEIYDREGDDFFVAWDLDLDGFYDDSNELSAFFTADINPELVDGDADLEFSIYVVEESAEGFEVFKDGRVEVENVDPMIISEPPLEARRGGLYSYRPEVVDPAGYLDPIEYRLAADEFPEGMEIKEGRVMWTPTEKDLEVGEHPVHLVVSDGDGGEFDQNWIVTVKDNAPPPAPVAYYPVNNATIDRPQPTFQFGTVLDPDGDAVTYHVQVDWSPNFDSANLMQTPPGGITAVEGQSFVAWQPPAPLMVGMPFFFWRVWANDGIEDSASPPNVFNLVDVEPVVDAGPDGGEGDAGPDGIDDGDGDDVDQKPGCGCRTPGSPVGGLAVLGIGLALVSVRRRRRSS